MEVMLNNVLEFILDEQEHVATVSETTADIYHEIFNKMSAKSLTVQLLEMALMLRYIDVAERKDCLLK